MKVTKIIIHHSLTKDGTVNDWKAIRRYHIEEKGWDDIGYHYGIENVGGKIVVQKGRAENVIGAHCLGMNDKSIGICVVGNYDLTEPTEWALKVLVNLCTDICKRYSLNPEDIETHHKYANYKTCPGTKFPMWKLRQMVARKLGGGRDL
jgi:N-acetylmuramoyl-L-alanine amidase